MSVNSFCYLRVIYFASILLLEELSGLNTVEEATGRSDVAYGGVD